MMSTLDDLPVFALGTVLFPDGTLPLRVFEARYLDMVRACMKQDAPFGVCLITRGPEVGQSAEVAPVGCLARISDWDMQQLGLLRISARGGQRFRVLSRKAQPDGLIRVRAEALPDDPDVPVPERFADCVELLRRVIDDHERHGAEPLDRMLSGPWRLDSAGWVANRLAELLPIAPAIRLSLMTQEDPVERLLRIDRILQSLQSG